MGQAGTWDPLLQCLHLDKHLLEPQNTKKLQGTKNNCMHRAVGTNYEQDTKRPKTQLPLLRSPEQKCRVSGAKVGYCTRPLHSAPTRG